MIIAGKAANERGVPVVLDPVGVAATPFRTAAVNQLLKEIRFTAIKGNAGEMAHLVQVPWETKGVESLGEGNSEEIAHQVAKTRSEERRVGKEGRSRRGREQDMEGRD